MRGVFLAVLVVAGCAQPAPPLDSTASRSPDFSRFVQCEWRNETVPGACQTGAEFEGEYVELRTAPPPGWLCFNWVVSTDTVPKWRLGWTPHATTDDGVQRNLGFEFDASPYVGPVDGWFTRPSAHAPRVWHFSSATGAGFVEFPDDVVENDIQYQIVLLPARGRQVHESSELPWTQDADPWWTDASVLYKAEGVPAPWPHGGELLWQRQEQRPGDWAFLMPTLGMNTEQGLAFFPSEAPFVFPEKDPSQQQGAGHSNTLSGRLHLTSVKAESASLLVSIQALAEIDGNMQDFTNPTWQFFCECPNKTVTDEPDWLRCKLGLPPPIVGEGRFAQTIVRPGDVRAD